MNICKQKNVPQLLISDYLIASKLTCSSACNIDLNLYCRIPTWLLICGNSYCSH